MAVGCHSGSQLGYLPADDGLATAMVIERCTCPCCRCERPDPGRDPNCRATARGSTATRPAELVPGPRIALLVDSVIGLAFHDLPGCETQCACSQAPPPPGRFPGLRGVDVVDVIAAGRARGAGLPLGLPDVV